VLPAEYQAMHLAEMSHWWFRGRRRLLVSLLQRFGVAGVNRLRVLDYGCGTGGNTVMYGHLGSVIGVEPDARAIRLAHARGGALYCRGNGVLLPFRGGAFDVVIASDVLEHIEDDSAAMTEIRRVLRPRGSVIIIVPAHQWLFANHDVALHHFRRYSKTALRGLLARSGFQITRLSYWNTALFPVSCLYRLVQQRHPSAFPRADTGVPLGLMNELLTALLSVEAALVRRVTLPWGLSLVAVAESYEERLPHSSSARSEESAPSGVTADPADERRNITASESQYHSLQPLSLASS
jgi:SAM-dependent methyltransferase